MRLVDLYLRAMLILRNRKLINRKRPTPSHPMGQFKEAHLAPRKISILSLPMLLLLPSSLNFGLVTERGPLYSITITLTTN